MSTRSVAPWTAPLADPPAGRWMQAGHLRCRDLAMTAPRSGLAWLWLAAAVILLDQASKLMVIDRLDAYLDVIPLTGFFNLVHVHNSGAAFSLFADQPGWQRWFFLGIAGIASAIIVFLLRKTPDRPLFAIALVLILGGAIGNVIDRILYGHVIDFLDFHYGGWHFPAFNVADSAITLGAALLIQDSFRKQA